MTERHSSQKATKTIVIFGGTFDPVHYGHLRAAAEVKTMLGEVDFRLLPSGIPPHRDITAASPQQRLQMLQLALSDHPDLHVDDREVTRNGPSYMYDTMCSLRKEAEQSSIILVLGQDAANDFQRWYRWRELFDLCHLLVMTRPESQAKYTTELHDEIAPRLTTSITQLHQQTSGLVCHIPVTQLAISATNIRHQIANNQNPRFLLPEPVLNFIIFNNLYKSYKN